MCYNIKDPVKFPMKSHRFINRKGRIAMILGLGMDLCPIARIAIAIEKRRFFERVYTPLEQQRLESLPLEKRRQETAAGLFAAKEAVAKALGTGFTDFGFADIEILPDALGKPRCRLTGRAETHFKVLGGQNLLITITHDGGIAAATAIIEGA